MVHLTIQYHHTTQLPFTKSHFHSLLLWNRRLPKYLFSSSNCIPVCWVWRVKRYTHVSCPVTSPVSTTTGFKDSCKKKKKFKWNVPTNVPPRRYFHLDVVGGLTCPVNPESYAGGSLATGRASQAVQVNTGRDQTKEKYPGPPGWGLGVRLTTSPHKTQIVTKQRQQPRIDGSTGLRQWESEDRG
jgi:hypothetical protein